MLKFQILVDAPQIMKRLARDISSAQKCIYIQAMTFEADQAGNQVLELIKQSNAEDKRLLVDSYSRIKISDHWVFSPRLLMNPGFRSEVQNTRNFAKNLPQAGIQFRWANPLGPLLTQYVNRNHKKMIIIDSRICYIGGLNFSDHNFSWHDMMLRLENREISKFLEQDFLASWNGQNQSACKRFDGLTLYLLDSQNNAKMFDRLFQIIQSATKHIIIETPYLSFPFYQPLRQAQKRGVKVYLITPKANNKKYMGHYSRWEIRRSGIYLWQLRNKMSHLKAMLIDDQTLIIGSSNFDYISYKTQQELFAVITDEKITAQFKKKILEPDYLSSDLFYKETKEPLGAVVYLLIKIFGPLLVGTSKLLKPSQK